MDLVFDIGGTNFRAALVRDHAVVWQETRPTPGFVRGLAQDEITAQLVQLIAECIDAHRDEVDRVGVAFPGPVAADGSVVKSPVVHGPAFAGPLPLRALIEEATGLSDVVVTNDMTAAAYRYALLYDAFCLVTVSTGIGNKVMVNGRPLIGPHGEGGEIGHAAATGLDFEIPCDCGCGTNHLCAISSGRGVVNVANVFKEERLSAEFEASSVASQPLSERVIARGADAGDAFCCAVIDTCTRPLAQALCVLLNAIYLRKVVMIGGFYFGCGYYHESLVRAIEELGVMGRTAEELHGLVVAGESDDLNGLLGLSRLLDAAEEGRL